MPSLLLQIFEYDFMTRALLVGVLLAIVSALVGVPLVLRGKAMLSDGLSHVAFGAIAFAMLLGLAPTLVAVVISIIAAILLLSRGKKVDSRNDAKIAIMSSSFLALGMLIISLQNSNIDPNSYLFGSILSLTGADLAISIIVSIISTLLFLAFYKQIFAISFDEEFARAIGINARFYDIVLSVICSVVVVLGMKICGSLLISAFIVFPPLCAMKISKNFGQTVIASVIIAVAAFLLGFAASFVFSLPIGATIAICETLCYIVCSIIAIVHS